MEVNLIVKETEVLRLAPDCFSMKILLHPRNDVFITFETFWARSYCLKDVL